MHDGCFDKNSGCLHTTPFTGNFDDICVFLHEYELFRTDSCSFKLVAGGLDGCRYFWVGGWGWFWVVADGFRWFWVISSGFGWFVVLVVTLKMYLFAWNIRHFVKDLPISGNTEVFHCGIYFVSGKMMAFVFILNQSILLSNWISSEVHLLWIYFLHQNTWIPWSMNLSVFLIKWLGKKNSFPWE